MRTRFLGYLVVALLLLIPLAAGQDGSSLIEPYDEAMVNPDANISFPPPVYVVRDSVEIRGSANLPNLVDYLIEFRPLALGLMDEDEEGHWFPATVTQRVAVVDDILGIWNTTTTRDGLYELRLKINTGDETEFVRLAPIRIENDKTPIIQAELEPVIEVVEESTPLETAEPTPEQEDASPRVVALVDSNVRAGDTTQYQIVGFLLEGAEAKILGVSSYGTGWYFIQLANGQSGFIHPSIVRAEGDQVGLERINPPPLPPTPIPIPTTIPVVSAPSTGANLVFGEIRMEPHPAVCNKTYTVHVTVRNDGNADVSSGFRVALQDSYAPTGAVLSSTEIGFGPIPAGHSAAAFGQITMNQYYNEEHHVNLRLDVHNQVAETREDDNHGATAAYILARGNC